MDREINKVATIGVFAHANAGKTTITEHLLYHTGVIKELGRVDSGNTITDNLAVERERGITVRDSLVSFQLNGKVFQLIDTPGHVDFSAEVERAVSVLDGAILVVSGVEGIEAQTYTIWNVLRQKGVPVILFINKMDRKGADYKRVLTELQKKLNITTINLHDVKQVENGDVEITPAVIEEVIEEVALVDDEIINSYLNGENISTNLLASKIITLVAKRKLFPVLGGSALKGVGIKELVKAIELYVPNFQKKIDQKLAAFVYTVRFDDNNRNAYTKIINGKLSVRDSVELDDERVGKVKSLYIAKGTELESVTTVYSGDIAVINGLDVKTGQIIGDQTKMNNYISFVKPLLNMEVNPINSDDKMALMEALRVLSEEDPYLNARLNQKTNSIYVSLMGEVQAQIIINMLEQRFNIKTAIEKPVIIHKETPIGQGQGSATFTSVSGIGIEVTPLERGQGFKYVSKVSTDFLHLKYQRQVERLINYYAKQGLYGWELTDVEVALIDGQFDSMGSEPQHFNIITPLALFRSLKKAKMKLLEPILKFTIVIPEDHLQVVIKSLTVKNGMFEITEHYDEQVTIEGEVAFANMINYPVELSKITSGRGTYSSSLSRYEHGVNDIVENDYTGPDPRNETTFVINDMNASLDALDKRLMKKKKESRSKFARQQREKTMRGR